MSRATRQFHVSAAALRTLLGDIGWAYGAQAVGHVNQPCDRCHRHDKIHLCHDLQMGQRRVPFKPTRPSQSRYGFATVVRALSGVSFNPRAQIQPGCDRAISGGVPC